MSNVVQFKARQRPRLQPEPDLYMRIDGGKPNEPGLYIYLPTMPRRIHRWTMRLIFGWRVTKGVERQ